MNYAQEADEYASALEIINYVFSVVFLVEAVLKLYGLDFD